MSEDLQRCIERIIAQGNATKIQALMALRGTKYFAAAQRRYNNQIKTDEWRNAMDNLIKFAVQICNTPESERDSLFAPEELQPE